MTVAGYLCVSSFVSKSEQTTLESISKKTHDYYGYFPYSINTI